MRPRLDAIFEQRQNAHRAPIVNPQVEGRGMGRRRGRGRRIPAEHYLFDRELELQDIEEVLLFLI